MSDIKFVEITELPEFTGRRGPRDSDSYRAYLAAAASNTNRIRVDATADELTRFYRSMIQWRNRHRDTGVRVRRDAGAVYVWIEDTPEEAPPPRRRRGRA